MKWRVFMLIEILTLDRKPRNNLCISTLTTRAQNSRKSSQRFLNAFNWQY